MAKKLKVRTRQKDGYTVVKTLITHPMETGLRKGSDGKLVPAHFIKEVVFKAGGKVVFRAHWGTGIAKNPYLSFRFKGAGAGDDLEIAWVDNTGESDTTTVKIK